MKIGNTIYLDFQATTPMDPRVLEAMIPYFGCQFGNPHSSEHSMGWQAAEATERAKQDISRLIGSDPDEVIFTSGATESNNIALIGLAKKGSKKRNKILISSVEHKSVIAVARELVRSYGMQLELMPVNKSGIIDLDYLAENIDDTVLAVSVMAVNNEIGTIQPIKKIGELTRESGAVFHCDAAQGPCSIDIDVYDMNIDILSLSAHKIYGPKGIGAIYIRRDIVQKIEPLLYGGGQQNNLRAGTVPVPLCVAFGKASELMLEPEISIERRKIGVMRDFFVDKLSELQWSTHLNGPENLLRHPGNANILFKGFSAHDLLAAVQPRLSASTGSACTSGTSEPSHVLEAIGLSDDEANSSIRFSFGRFTKREDIDEAIELIKEALIRLDM
jgi:cysteine desulfurase